MPITVQTLSEGLPSLAVLLTLEYLGLEYTNEILEYGDGVYTTEEFSKKNPQKELPLFEEDGFYIAESVAIMQYLAEKYPKDDTLYPKDIRKRARVNQLLCFDLSMFYPPVLMNAKDIIREREQTSLPREKQVVEVFETYLQQAGTKYSAGDHITLADLHLVGTVVLLEANMFDITPYRLIQKWYATFKKEYPELWKVAERCLKALNDIIATRRAYVGKITWK